MINCPSCGGVLKYDIASAQMKCASCDSLFDPYIFDNVKEDAETEETYEARIYVCPGCGAELATADETDITSVCSYCGYPRIIFDRIENEKRPDNATFISFAPFDDPKISVSVMIPHGYTSGNASELGRFIYNYYYGFLTYEEILSGEAIDEGGNEINE